jgi:hypothetical protein
MSDEDRVPGPDHRLEINHADNVVVDEATGTPPFIPAAVRSALYIGTVIVDVLAFMVLGILPIFEILDVGRASQLGLVIVTGLNMLTVGLAVGYRPTRPGSPIGG